MYREHHRHHVRRAVGPDRGEHGDGRFGEHGRSLEFGHAFSLLGSGGYAAGELVDSEVMTGQSTSGAARGPGRPRSEQARGAVLSVTTQLLHEVGLRAMTTDDAKGDPR